MDTKYAEKNNSFVDNQEYTVGDKIYFNQRLEKVLDKLTDMVDLDIYNEKTDFNKYERGVRRLESLLTGYMDESYVEERNNLSTTKPVDIKDKINKLDKRTDLCMYLMKRKRFTPLDDITETSYFIVRDIIQRIHDEYDAQIVVYGPRGTGKSTLAIELSRQIAERMNLEFDVNKHVFTNSIDLRNYIYKNKPKPGQPLIWDEATAGKGMGRRRAMTSDNIEYSEVIEVIREMGLVMFYTTPEKDFGDSKTITMFSCSIQTVRLDRLERITIVKYKFRRGKIWVYLNDANGNRINRMIIPKAPQHMINDYKKIKVKLMSEKVKVRDKTPKKLKADTEKIKKEILDNKNLYKNSRGRYDTELIYGKFKDKGLTRAEARVVQKEVSD